MTFGLVTAINIEDVPIILQNAARNYLTNAQHDQDVILEHKNLRKHYPELWKFAAQMLEEVAQMLQSQIDSVKAQEAPIKISKRAIL
jgi:hypothetical protein